MLCPSIKPFVYIGLKVGVNYSCPKSYPAESNTARVEGDCWVTTGRMLNDAATLSSAEAGLAKLPELPAKLSVLKR